MAKVNSIFNNKVPGTNCLIEQEPIEIPEYHMDDSKMRDFFHGSGKAKALSMTSLGGARGYGGGRSAMESSLRVEGMFGQEGKNYAEAIIGHGSRGNNMKMGMSGMQKAGMLSGMTSNKNVDMMLGKQMKGKVVNSMSKMQGMLGGGQKLMNRKMNDGIKKVNAFIPGMSRHDDTAFSRVKQQGNIGMKGMFLDSDKDGVVNILDCEPHNKKKQGPENNLREKMELYGILKPMPKANHIDAKQMRMGQHVEMEHTTNPMVAKRIAAHHVSEIPDYYTRLNMMEGGAKKGLPPGIYNADNNAMKRLIIQRKIGSNLFGDSDKDGVPNIYDCEPFNKKKQGPEDELADKVMDESPKATDYGTPYSDEVQYKTNPDVPKVTEDFESESKAHMEDIKLGTDFEKAPLPEGGIYYGGKKIPVMKTMYESVGKASDWVERAGTGSTQKEILARRAAQKEASNKAYQARLDLQVAKIKGYEFAKIPTKWDKETGQPVAWKMQRVNYPKSPAQASAFTSFTGGKGSPNPFTFGGGMGSSVRELYGTTTGGEGIAEMSKVSGNMGVSPIDMVKIPGTGYGAMGLVSGVGAQGGFGQMVGTPALMSGTGFNAALGLPQQVQSPEMDIYAQAQQTSRPYDASGVFRGRTDASLPATSMMNQPVQVQYGLRTPIPNPNMPMQRQPRPQTIANPQSDYPQKQKQWSPYSRRYVLYPRGPYRKVRTQAPYPYAQAAQ